MYIGNDLQIAHPSYKIIDDISSGFNGSTTSFALQVSGATPVPFPISTQQVMISVNGVVQEPDPTGSAGFKLLGSNIVFSSAPANGHAFFGVINAGADYVTAGSEFPDGSATAPSFTFQDDQDTGWYRISSGSVGYSANGVQILDFDGNGLNIPDNKKLQIGSGPDLKIFHDANHSYIQDSGTGNLNIDSSSVLIRNAGGTENIAKFIADGAVELYHDNSKKLETSATGATVTGNLKIANSGQSKILLDTSDASDNKFLSINGGGEASQSRGAGITFYGNEVGSNEGRLWIGAGNSGSANGFINFNTAGLERARFDTSGRFVVGHSSSYEVYTTSKVQVLATDGSAGLSISRWSNNSSSGYLNIGKSRGGIGTATIVQDNDRLGQINFVGADGTDLVTAGASISAYVDGTPGSNDMPGRLIFSTTADGAASETERMRIDNSGRVLLGTQKTYSDASYYDDITINNSNGSGASGGTGITLIADASSWNAILFGDENDHDVGAIKYDHNSNSMQFTINASERFRIASSGQLGIGGANYGTSGQVLTSGGSGAAFSWTTISAAPEITATASGAIAAGKPVAVNANGTVSTVVSTFNAVNPPTLIYQEENDNTFNASGLDCCYDAGNDRWFVATKFSHPSYLNRWGFRVYQDKADSGTWTSGQGGAWDPITGNGMGWGQMVLAAQGKPIFFYLNGNSLQAQIGTYNSSNEDISWSTVNETGGGAGLQAATESFSVARIEDNKFAILFQNTNGNKCACIIATLSGTNLTKHTEVELSGTNETQTPKIMWDSTNSRLVAHYAGHLRTGTLSGNSQTWGSESSAFSYSGSTTSFSDIAYDVSADRYIICFYNSSNQGCYVLGTRSGNNMSVSSVYVFQSTSAVSHINVAYSPEIERIAIIYNHSSGSNGKIRQGKITPSSNPPISFGSDYGFGSGSQKFTRLFYSTTNKTFFGMWQGNYSQNGKNQAARWNVGSLSSTSTSFVGFVDSAVSDGNTATIKVSGNTTTGQSGLTTGTKYYIGRSGGLVTTAETPEVVAGVALSASSLLIQ